MGRADPRDLARGYGLRTSFLRRHHSLPYPVFFFSNMSLSKIHI